MSMMAMSQPATYAPFKREFGWPEFRSPDYAPSRPRMEPERVALPSIRQVCLPSASAQGHWACPSSPD